MISTIIYCLLSKRGEAQFDEIMQGLQEKGIELDIKKRKNGSSAINRLNGDTWRVVCANDGARGYKWDYALVDEEISLRVYKTIILPSCKPKSEGMVTFY